MKNKILIALLLIFVKNGITNPVTLEGIIDFGNTRKISNALLILTNPKSGSHLLTYSLVKITGRPLIGREVLSHFTPSYFVPENIMNYPLDYAKPAIYWGHEYFTLMKIKNKNNKLIFINRDFKENILSQVTLNLRYFPDTTKRLEDAFREEILKEGQTFKEYLYRLQVYDKWNPDFRHLISYNDLVKHPENFIPGLMKFIEDESEYLSFINSYESFKKDLLKAYRLKAESTGAESDLRFFRQFVSKQTLQEIDEHIEKKYPDLWERYLKEFKEEA